MNKFIKRLITVILCISLTVPVYAAPADNAQTPENTEKLSEDISSVSAEDSLSDTDNDIFARDIYDMETAEEAEISDDTEAAEDTENPDAVEEAKDKETADDAEDLEDELQEEAEDAPQEGEWREIEHSTGYIESPYYSDPDPVSLPDDELQDLVPDYISPYAMTHGLRDQSPFGTCWAFAAIGAGEFSLMADGKDDPDLSELHLAYFAFHGVEDPLGGTKGDQSYLSEEYRTNFLKHGANIEIAANTLASWTGAADEKKVPYTSSSSVNAGTKIIDPALAYDDIAHLENIYEVSIHRNPESVKKLIMEYGGCAVSFYACDGYSAATSDDIYNEKTNSYYCPAENGPNHGVMIVGWDDNYSRSNFAVEPETDGAWLIRNSWTRGTFENNQNYSGYFWMSYCDKTLRDTATFLIFDDADVYDHNYQYDGNPIDWAESVKKAANVFTVSGGSDSGEQLEAVSFSVGEAEAKYTVDIYKNPDPDNPESGQKVSTVSGKTLYSGRYTVELPKVITLAEGDTFSVVVTFDKATIITYESEVSSFGGFAAFPASAERGQSFASSDTAWFDSGRRHNGNLRIKAYTSDINGQTVAPESIVIPDEIAENGLTINKEDSRAVEYTVLPENATNKKLTWTSSDEDVATVNSRGVITAIETGTATITATSKLGNAEASFTVNVTCNPSGIVITSPIDKRLRYGQSYPLTYRPAPMGAVIEGNAAFSTSDSRIACVENGNLKVCGGGEVRVTVTLGGFTDTREYFCALDAPEVTAVFNESDRTAKISFNSVPGATDYYVYRYGENGSVYVESFVADGREKYECTDDLTTFTGRSLKYRVCTSGVVGGICSEGFSDLIYTGRKYSITYKPGKGANAPGNPEYIHDGETVTIKPPIAPEGYLQQGWKDSRTHKTVTSLPIKNKYDNDDYRDYTLTAKYRPIRYTVSFIPNGGNGNMDDVSGRFDATFTLPACAFTRDGWIFDRWNTEADGTGTSYKDKDKVINLVSEDGATVCLYAQWGGKKFSVTLDGTGGKIINGKTSSAKQTVQVASKGRYQGLPVPERKGYVFTGWYTGANTGDKVQNGDAVRENIKTLYAHWNAIESTVSFDGNGADLYCAPIKVLYGGKYGVLPEPEEGSEGNPFFGWYAEKECIRRITEDTVVTAEIDHTLYAGWKMISKVSEPQFNPLGEQNDGCYEEGIGIELTCQTPGAVIYYKTGDGEPYKEYTEPVTAFIDGKTAPYDFSITAKAVKTEEDGKGDYNESTSSTVSYKIKPAASDNGDIIAEDLPTYVSEGRPAYAIWTAGIDPHGYKYDGTQIKPAIRVYSGKRLLKEGSDYKLSYQNNTNAYTFVPGDGDYNEKKAPAVKITFAGVYSGSRLVPFVITPLSIADDAVFVPETVTVQRGSRRQEKIADLTFTDAAGKTVKLRHGKDFKCEFSETSGNFTDTNEEGYEVTVRGCGNFTDTTTYKEVITEKILISKATIKDIENKECTGQPLTQEWMMVYYRNEPLREGDDYTVSYPGNHTDVGTATVCIKGCGRFSGEVYKTFKITGIPMNMVSIPANMGGSSNTKYCAAFDMGIGKFVYTGLPMNVAGEPDGTDNYGAELTDLGRPLCLGTDYTVSYDKNTEAGNAAVTFTGKGKYTGSVKKTFSIAQYNFIDNTPDVSLVTITMDGEAEYEKGGAVPTHKITYKNVITGAETELTEGVHYTVKYSDNTALSAKTPKAVITFKGSIKGKAERFFNVTKKSMGKTRLDANDRQGSNRANSWSPSFTVFDTNGKKLMAGSDYEKDPSVIYETDTLLADGTLRKRGTQVQKNDIQKPGTVLRLTVKGTGNYEGSVSTLYRVYGYDISKAKVTVDPQKHTGRPVCPGKAAMTVILKIDGRNQEIGAGDFYIAGYENNIAKGTGKVTIKGIGRCGGTKTVTFAIK
ncbi:MAG: InlB B-repeat-containing protein [Lachnospiraceae bacterium]|nr:InlB B-repeat-containing protein [Lachnospiraceae bacterium]